MPVNIPSFSVPSDVRSMVLCPRTLSMNSDMGCSYSVPFINSLIMGCSGAKDINVTPKIVSGLVVKHGTALSDPSNLKSIFAPSLLPIQFACIVFTLSGHPSSVPRSSSSLCAKSLILKNHCSRSRCLTFVSHLSQRSSTTCSFASTVAQEGHQFTAAFFLYARLRSNSLRNIH